MDNKLYNIDDALIVTIEPKIIGKVIFTSFIENIVGVTSNRYLDKYFRFSNSNGLFWSDWILLNNNNLSAISDIITENSLIIEIKYVRKGIDSTGEIEFIDIEFIGDIQNIEFIAPTLFNSIFRNLFSKSCLKKIEFNLFKKLYFPGIIPKYITRGENNDEKEDRDFIDLTFSIARFYSLLICFFKRYEDFNNDYQLMLEHVRQYSIYFNENETPLEDLQYLSQNLFDEVRRRGTILVLKRKGDKLSSGNTMAIDGEIIRLLNNKRGDELLYESLPINLLGWCIGNSSPSYRGTSQSKMLNKTGFNEKDFNEKDEIFNETQDDAIIDLEDFEGKKVLNFLIGNGIASIGRIDRSQEPKQLFNVDSKMSYEITFAFYIEEVDSADIKFGIEGFDVNGKVINNAFITPNGDVINDTFFEKELNLFTGNQWYFARGIIHAYSTANVDEDITNLGIGTNLYFNNSFVKNILPYIKIEGINSKVKIWDYKIRPLVRGRNILPLRNGNIESNSLCFIQCPNFNYIYIKNNNNIQTKEEITNIIEKYLLPYNSVNKIIYL